MENRVFAGNCLNFIAETKLLIPMLGVWGGIETGSILHEVDGWKGEEKAKEIFSTTVR